MPRTVENLKKKLVTSRLLSRKVEEIFPSLKARLAYDLFQNQGRRLRGAWGALAPQFLAKQLTLSQPGGQIIPTTVLRAPPEFQTLRRA